MPTRSGKATRNRRRLRLADEIRAIQRRAAARDGRVDAESIAFEETEAGFEIAWPGSYRLDGPAFVYTDRQSRRVSTIIGYPTQLLAAAERR